MLDYLRRSSSAIGVKLMLGMLIASFAVWGIGDIFRTKTGGESVATVGEADIGVQRFRSELAREIDRVGQILGQQISREQALSMGVDQMLLQRLINAQIMQEGAKDMGLAASDAVVLNEIKKNTEFYSEAGQFDRRIYSEVLSRAGLSEAGYVARVRESIARQQFLAPISAGTVAPTTLVDTLYKRVAETRVLEVVRITHAKVKDVTPPNDAEMATYHTENSTRFMAPEYRAVTALVLSADEMGKSIDVTPAELATAYDERADEFATPEVRTLSQVLVKDEAVAKTAAQLLDAGKSLADVVAEVGANAGRTKLGTFTRAEAAALSADMADAAFTPAKGAHSAPVKSPLGWHVLVVDDITPGAVRTLDEVKEQLIASIRDERTLDLLFQASNQLDDLLGGGQSLEEAAASLGVNTVKIAAVDATGAGLDGKPIDSPYAANLVAQAFDLSEGADSAMLETDDHKAFYVLRVDGVTPPALRPLDTVKTQVAAAMMQERLSAKAAEIAKDVKARLEAGDGAAAVAHVLGFDAFTTEPFNRLGNGLEMGALPATLMEETFTLKVGGVADALGTGAHTVARLKSVTEANLDTTNPVYRSIHDNTLQALQTDLATQLAVALQARYPVIVNQAAMSDLAN